MTSYLFIGREILANLLMGIPMVRAWRLRRGRTAVGDFSAQVRLILDQFKFFMDAVGWDRLKGSTVAEIGPGDAIPQALLFLGAGAREYIAIDRFLGDVDGPSARTLYKGVAELAPERVKEGWSAQDLDPAQFPWPDSFGGCSRVRLHSESIESADPRVVGQVDVIVSYNVVEHLSDISAAFARMTQLLAPDGLMAHRVDYTPHGRWKDCRNPLTFLTVEELLWSLMGSNRGYPNRARHCHVMSTINACGFESRTRITGRYSLENAENIRPSLPPEVSVLSDEDLRIADAEIISSRTDPSRNLLEP